MPKLTRLCAWCRCVVDDNGQPGRELSKAEIAKLRGAISHTCCHLCKTTVVAPEIDDYLNKRKMAL